MIAAVTGTKGKTTIVSMINYCLSSLGYSTSSICTLGIYRGLNRITNKAHVPVYDRFFEREMNTDHQCIELTSHLLLGGIAPEGLADVVVLTGIERGEHEETHPLFKDYLAAKRKIYNVRKKGKKAIVCADDLHFEELTRGNKNLITYGFSESAHLKINVVSQTMTEAVLEFSMEGSAHCLVTKILGRHNYLNLAASYLALTEMEVSSSDAIKTLSTFSGLLGRFEKFKVKTHTGEKTVVIDYAHTPGSLRNTLVLLREIYPVKTICTVFGCGGNKSITKRPLMGREATLFSNFVILTSDNPRHECPEKIIDHILVGAITKCDVELKRELAIELALEKECDVILLAGKGAEEEYKIGDKVYLNRSDRKLLESICKEKNYKLFPETDHI